VVGVVGEREVVGVLHLAYVLDSRPLGRDMGTVGLAAGSGRPSSPAGTAPEDSRLHQALLAFSTRPGTRTAQLRRSSSCAAVVSRNGGDRAMAHLCLA